VGLLLVFGLSFAWLIAPLTLLLFATRERTDRG
jgi:hypothetical protein